MQFGFKGTTDEIFCKRDAGEVHSYRKKSSIFTLWIGKKLLIGFREK